MDPHISGQVSIDPNTLEHGLEVVVIYLNQCVFKSGVGCCASPNAQPWTSRSSPSHLHPTIHGNRCKVVPLYPRTNTTRGWASRKNPNMASNYFQESAPLISQDVLPPITPSVGVSTRSSNALSSRITSVLSASYADLDIRDALETLDARGIQNTPETRRQLRLDIQKEVIQCNGEIVKDFGQVAEVISFSSMCFIAN